MASRVVFVCHENGEEHSPGIYLHWGGGQALELLRRAAPRMNMYDASEAAARLCGFLHEELPGSTGIALLPPPIPAANGQIDWEQYSPGDWGIVIIDVLDAKAECFAGQLAGQIILNLPLDQSEL